ncbi:hypothetical protein PG993_004169 [Apiospora rasikravindrae]|uniref:Uncharacterized protein n=1 Tax=Apiospora rasikravindrae TaxID=990691 RepID=A0ABR1TC06_9PEZI
MHRASRLHVVLECITQWKHPPKTLPRSGQPVQHDGADAREPGPDPGGGRVDGADLAEAAAAGPGVGLALLLLLAPALRGQRDAVLVEGDLAPVRVDFVVAHSSTASSRTRSSTSYCARTDSAREAEVTAAVAESGRAVVAACLPTCEAGSGGSSVLTATALHAEDLRRTS